ncbi:caspase family protein [Frigoriglobus tundricola]|uniref:Peptidase C14 caspase domain-containing protein n=1 Tax=Frigoriglobus tundricola TaxID=2774151 RepID=A0A6M5YXP0_9BACT|nr:caspase family protein [Frigoriglobus tundricola]QJW97973.1 hypothetical protein FTUN_5553 [Frigoriglobus tundricola]
MRCAVSLVAALALASTVFAQEPKAAFPRRMLFVHVADYLYLNPLTRAAPGGPDRVREAAGRLAFGFRVPNSKDNDQLFVLADTPAADARLPTKAALVKAMEGFCETTRGQDRVVIYFGVHVVEKDGKAFVVPIDGDPAAAGTLLPVADVYARLKELKAAQKVVIWDVCRQNPDRVRGRREPGPMTLELFRALAVAPAGVEVLLSCSPGEHALEYFVPRGTAGTLPGSAYLDALRQAAIDTRVSTKAEPGDAVPVEVLHKSAVRAVAAVAYRQTPLLVGTAPKLPVEFNPSEAPAKRFELPAFQGPQADAKAILDELALPAILEDDRAPLARLPYSEAALKGYAPDVSVEDALRNLDRYPLRGATLRAVQTVRNVWRLDAKEQKAVATLSSPISDRAKRAVSTAQDSVAITIAELETELARLEGVADKRAKETKRWQAHYDLVVAELRLRLVVLNEYNRALGHVKTETLPDLPKSSTGWRLVPTTKIEGRKDVGGMFAAAGDGFTKIAAEHVGTPWEVLAKRSLAVLPGVRWEPIVAPASEGK